MPGHGVTAAGVTMGGGAGRSELWPSPQHNSGGGKKNPAPGPDVPEADVPSRVATNGVAGESVQIGAKGSNPVEASIRDGENGAPESSALGATAETGLAGTSEILLPHRVRTKCFPSVRIVSPIRSVNL